MKMKSFVLVGVALLAGRLTALHAADGPKKETHRDYDSLARNVVSRSARILNGERVAIYGQFTDAPVLEALAVQVRKQGAHPLIVADSDRLRRRLFDEVPARFDSQELKFLRNLAECEDAVITVSSHDNTALAGVRTERLMAAAKAQEAIFPLLLKRNVRLVELGNGLYPTPSRAKEYGLSEEELANIFWNGLNVDYAWMQATGEELQRILSAGKELHLTHANGTDLKMQIERRPVFVSDGTLTQEKLQKGGPAVQTFLPAGEVYLAPVSASTEGKVLLDRVIFQGKEVTGLMMTVHAGKVTDLRAKAGGERLLAMYHAAGAGKENFAAIDIGINPNVRIPRDSKLLVYMAAGIVSVWAGNDVWVGGDNSVPTAVGGFLPGSTVKVDGRIIVENGELKL
jgi:leucyl aminopeptidase (aminopeptidase T)